MVAKNRLKLAALILLAISISSFYSFHSFSMFQKASELSEDASTSLSVFTEAADWLSSTLQQNEFALVPMREVFYALSPQLRDKLVDYQSMWNSSGIVLKADTTIEEALQVRNYFIRFIKENPQVKYVVRDWVDPYAKRIFDAATNDELALLLQEVEAMPFVLSNGWGSQITIYERMQFTALFAMKFSSPPARYFYVPSNNSIKFTSDGVTIQKVGERVGFYLPLESSINTSSQLNYLTIKVKPSVENLDLALVFYYDANGDGNFSGYDIDYVKSATFSQTELGWEKDQSYEITQIIPYASDPLVQLSFIMTGDKDGEITLTDLIVYTETTSESIFVDASKWLSENLKENEIALVPSLPLFSFANPSLKGKLVDYYSLWRSSGVVYGLDTTREEMLQVRDYLIRFLKENPQVKYVVRDWVDSYAESLYGATTDDELMLLLQQVHEIPFKLIGGWTRVETIYEKMQYTNLFTMNFSSPPQRYFAIPSTTSLQFNSDGVTIQKADQSVGFYLPLDSAIDATKQNYFAMQFKLDLENVDFTMVFYYDRNRDGVFSGYEVDYVKGINFDYAQHIWAQGRWYQIAQTIPKSDDADPVVQISIIATSDTTGNIIIADLAVYTK